jgi:hypothetical protein
MENFEKLMEEAYNELFKTKAIIYAAGEKLADLLNYSLYKKYENKIIERNGLEYKLEKIRINYIFECKSFDVSMYYFCNSKLPKSKVVLIESKKNELRLEKYLHPHNSKNQLWFSNWYQIDLKKVLLEDVNLEIK